MQGRPINLMRDVERFLEAWDNPDAPFNHRKIQIFATAYDNLNDTGEPGPDRGVVLTRWHQAFSVALEPGVRDLVLILVEKFGLVTYTSCQGHDYSDLGMPSAERNIGILPRSEPERNFARNILDRAPGVVSDKYDISIRVADDVLRSKVPGKRSRYPVVDMYFVRPEHLSWDDYLTKVELPYDEALEALRQLPAPASRHG